MKQATLITTIALMLLWGCSHKPKKQAAIYTDYDRGYSFHYYQKSDSAFIMFSRYVVNADDSLNKGKAYRYMGEILWRYGDLYGAQDYLNRAIHILDALDADKLLPKVARTARTINTLDSLDAKLREELGAAYNISGNVLLDLNLYDEAIDDYNKAVVVLKGLDYLYEPLNGKAMTLQRKEKFAEAIAVYDSIALLNPGDALFIARVTDNKAKTKWLQDPGYFALPEFWSALKVRFDNEDTTGLNASYAHLSDYYQHINPDSALLYAQKMLDRATANKSPGDRLEALDKLIRFNKTAALKDGWYNEHERLNDSVRFAIDTTKNRFGKIRYDFQQERTDKLLLEKDVANKVKWIYALIIVAIVIIAGLYMRHTKRRRQIKQESENAIRESKLKTSQKVHDVVANQLYRIMNELEHTDKIEREPLLDKIEVLYEKSRDISYEDVSPARSPDDTKQVHELLMAFDHEQTHVFITGNEQSFWNRIKASTKDELHLVLNEIMINMQKHSQAKHVTIVFGQEHNQAFIMYADDGVGFPADFEHGNGLTNTVSRIAALNGDVNFGKSDQGGAAIDISFPL